VVLVQIWVVSQKGRVRSRRIWVILQGPLVPASASVLPREVLPAVSSQPPSYLPLLPQLLSALGQRGALSSCRLSEQELRGVGLCSVRGYGGWLLYLCLLLSQL